DVLGVELDFDVVGFREDGYGDGGGVDAALLFGDGDALHAVHAALIAELAIDLVAADEGDDFLQAADGGLAAGGDFDLPALGFGVAGIHAEDLVGKERGLVAAGAGANFEDDVLLVEGILGEHE